MTQEVITYDMEKEDVSIEDIKSESWPSVESSSSEAPLPYVSDA